MIRTGQRLHAPPPDADRLGRIRVVPGTVTSTAGRSCTLLLVHDPLRPGEDGSVVSRDMLGLASGLGLTPSWRASRHLVRRAVLVEGMVVLDYGHDRHILQGPVDHDWYDLAAAAGYIRLSVGLDPLPDDQASDAGLYTEASKAAGSLWSGITTARVATLRAR